MPLLGWFQRLFQQPPDRPGIRYTPRAASVLNFAKEVAEKNGQAVPTVSDVCLALCELNKGCAAQVLKRFGVDADKIRRAAATLATDDSFQSLLPVAQEEMRKLNHQYLGTEHLLLALLRTRNNPMSTILSSEGITVEIAREAVLRELDPNYTPNST